MLKTRVKTGAVLTVVVLLVLWFSYVPYVMSGCAALLGVVGTIELYRAADAVRKRGAFAVSLVLAAALPFALPRLPVFGLLAAVLLIAAAAAFLALMPRLASLSFRGAGGAFAVSLMIAVFYSALPALRDAAYGLYYVCLVILTSVVTDVAAYFVGRAVGKHKLAPVVSPKKTIEGSVGGVLAAVVIGLILGAVLSQTQGVAVRWAAFVCYLIIASLAGQLGDLSMSVVKRAAGIKDFGNLMPGHGGVLDRFDSQLFIAPLTLAFCAFWPLFPKT